MLGEFVGVEWLFWWQIPLLLCLIAVSLFGNGTMLWVGGRFAAKLRRATYWRCFVTNILAWLAGSAVTLIVSLSVSLLGRSPILAIVAKFLGGICGLLVTWAVISARLRSSYSRAMLAWLPTLATGILTVPLLISLLLPSLGRAREMAKTAVCQSNLNAIGKAIALYSAIHGDTEYPPDLATLTHDPQPLIDAKTLHCPSDENLGAVSYFYLQPIPSAPDDQIIACDLKANHMHDGRCVLYTNGTVAFLKGPDFAEAMKKPVNARFANALAAAEAQATSQPRQPSTLPD